MTLRSDISGLGSENAEDARPRYHSAETARLPFTAALWGGSAQRALRGITARGRAQGGRGQPTRPWR